MILPLTTDQYQGFTFSYFFVIEMRPIRDGDKWHGTLLLLVLALVLRLGEFEGNIGHIIPGVVDADEQQQHRCRGDDEQCRCRMAWEHNRRDEPAGVGDQREDRMKQ